MGFSGAKALLGTLPSKKFPGWAFWQGQCVCVELHSFLAYNGLLGLPTPYKLALARHHHDGAPLPSPTRSKVADMAVGKAVDCLAKLGLDLAEPRGDTIIEGVMEAPYEPKALCAKLRATKLKSDYEALAENGATLSDCVVRLALPRLAKKFGVHNTVPPAEFDAISSIRLRQGWYVLSGSGDSDLLMYVMGYFKGKLVHTKAAGDNVVIADFEAKVVLMERALGVQRALLTAHEAVFMQYEAVLLQAALFGGHDYNHSETEAGVVRNATGMGDVTRTQFLLAVGRAFEPETTFRRTVEMDRAKVTAAVLAAAKFVRETPVAKIDAKTAGAVYSCNRTDAQLESSFLAFWEHPVTLNSGGQRKSNVLYCNALFDAASTKVEHDDDEVDVADYNYRGACGDCVHDPDAWVMDQHVCQGLQYENVSSDSTKPWYSKGGTAFGRVPKSLTGDVVQHVAFVGSYSNFSINAGGFSALNLVMDLLQRCRTIPTTSWSVAELPPSRVPPGTAVRVKGEDVMIVVVQAKVLQSYGAKMKEKASLAGTDVKDQYYTVRQMLQVSKVSGRVIAYPHGSSIAKDGFLAVLCPCNSPFPECHHATILKTAMSRLSEGALMSSTTSLKYWGKEGAAPDAIEGHARRISECITDNLTLGEVAGDTEQILAALETYV